MNRIFVKISVVILAISSLGFAVDKIVVTPDALKEAATRYIVNQTNADPDQVTLTFLNMPNKVFVSQAVEEIKVIPGTRGLFRGSSILYIGLYAENELLKKVPITIRARILKPVLVAAQMIDRHTSLNSSMVDIEMIDITKLSGVPMHSMSEIAGLQTTRIVGAGRVLLDSMVEKPPAVMRGDRVIISVTIGAVTASTPGEVKADGRIGEHIRVRNLVSGQEVYARVLDTQTVIIDSPRRRRP